MNATSWIQQDMRELAAFAKRHRLRLDWHEPDEQDVTAHIIGRTLDNAFGNIPYSRDYANTNIVEQ